MIILKIFIFIVLGILSFLLGLILIKKWMVFCIKKKLYGNDMNKLVHPKVPEMGGIPTILNFFIILSIGIIILKILHYLDFLSIWQIVAVYISITGFYFIGIIDDIYDLRKYQKAIIPILFGIPIALYFPITINILTISISFPNIFTILLISFMIDAAANSSNMLEGYNGLGVGLTILMNIPILIISIIKNNIFCTLLSIIFLGSCLAFYRYNRYPAQLFPGDVLTLTQGAILAIIAIIGNFEELGVFIFTPMIINAIFSLSRQNTDYVKFCYRNKFGIIKYYRSVIAIPQFLAKNFHYNEWEITLSLHFFQFIISLSALLIYLIV